MAYNYNQLQKYCAPMRSIKYEFIYWSEFWCDYVSDTLIWYKFITDISDKSNTFFRTASSELLSLSSTGARNFPSTPSNCSSVSADPIRRKTRSTNAVKANPFSPCLFRFIITKLHQQTNHGLKRGICASVALCCVPMPIAQHCNRTPTNTVIVVLVVV